MIRVSIGSSGHGGDVNPPIVAPVSRFSEKSMSAAQLDAGLGTLGYQRFRTGQREAVETLLAAGRLLLVAPTGGGKSLTYQLPATLLPGTTLVVSPLISLMHDQVHALEERGIPATFLASTLSSEDMRSRMSAISRGSYKLVYVAPERLAFQGFRNLLRDLDCPLVAIDEAHCISEWGHDFRPDYGQLGSLVADFPDALILACTATATPIVRDEILERLGLPTDTPQCLHGFARPNLGLRVHEVTSKKQRESYVDALLTEAIGAPGEGRGAAIVYAPTRRTTEEEGRRLAAAGWRAHIYHAGLDADLRNATQRAFAGGEAEVVVATNAFGMGIDRADVRAVAHLAPPSSLEAYYQEVGRAGRDGDAAAGMLLISPGDMALRRHLIEAGAGAEAPKREIVRHKWNLFLELMRWAEGGSCRHDAILRYFGDDAETLEGCGRCDVCLGWLSDEQPDPDKVTLIVRKALSSIARIHGRLGLSAAVKLLRGSPDPRLDRYGLNESRTFGALSEYDEDWLTRLLRRCVTAGWVDFEGGDRPVVALTAAGIEVMRGKAAARLVLPPSGPRKTPSTGGSRRRRARGGAGEETLDARARELFEALRHYRVERARAQGVPPYLVASDRTLRDIARMRPASLHDLEAAHGIGPAKAKRYGAGLLRLVAEHR